MRSVQHYCQKCLAANPLGQTLCGRCGTRLMLVVEPPAARFEDSGLIAAHEEHLLERISALENRLLRMADRLEQTLDLMLKQARTAYTDHTLIETLIAVLHEAGVVKADNVIKIWRERCRQETVEKAEIDQREELRRQIISAYSGNRQSIFEQYVNKGIELIGKKDLGRGIRTLERAAALDADNGPLHTLIGEHFFETGKTALAIDYLGRALAASSNKKRVRLLLGLACGDAGELDRARLLLKDSLKQDGESFAAHYGLGMLLIAEQKWVEALKEFKGALAARPSAEAHYLTGCAYYYLDRYRMAARHLQKAVEMDGSYGAAFYALGLALLRLGEQDEARAAFSSACENAADEPRYRSSAKRLLRSNEQPVNPKFFGMGRGSKKGLITGVDKRLAQIVQQDALASGSINAISREASAC